MKSLAAVVAALLVSFGAANAGEFVIYPKASDGVVVLTIRGGKVVKASVIAEPEPVAKPDHLKDTAASLIGHSGSSAFRLSTTPVSMSLAGSRFSPDSAPRPFHHGFRRRGGTIFRATLPSM